MDSLSSYLSENTFIHHHLGEDIFHGFGNFHGHRILRWHFSKIKKDVWYCLRMLMTLLSVLHCFWREVCDFSKDYTLAYHVSPSLWLISCFLFVFWFFNSLTVMFLGIIFVCVYFPWSLLSFLDLWVDLFHSFLKSSDFFFFFSFLLQSFSS